MKNILLLLFCSVVMSFSALAQKTEVIKFDRLQALMDKKGDKVTVINFWATWCGPCVKELPYFESVAAVRQDIEVYLISLDFVEKLDRVNSFIERKKLKSRVLLLDEIDYNSWIDRVDKSWSGAIPATLLLNPATGKRKFVESELEEGELEQLIEEISN
ncbi:TlpA disulfide reductase family protein [Fulvivirga imtechensis]|nr:TlpA disulfide reductase family protein [Fulvivirga imtechensis]